MVKKSIKWIYLALVLLFLYTPLLLLIVYSFTNSDIVGNWQGFSFALYIRLFKNKEIMGMVRDTMVLALLAATVSTILGTLGAIGLFYSKKRTASVVEYVSNIPLVNTEIVTAVSLALLFSLLSGRSYFSLLTGHVVICVPFVVLSVMPKLKQMDPHLYEAALDLGATPARAMFKIVLPEILPGIIAGFMLAVTLSLDDYIVTAFTAPEGFDTISTYVYNAVKTPRNDLPALRALSALIFVAIILIVLGFNLIKTKNDTKQRSEK